MSNAIEQADQLIATLTPQSAPQTNAIDEADSIIASISSSSLPFTDLTAEAYAGRPVPGTLLGDLNRDGRLNIGEGVLAVGRQFAYGVKDDLPRMLGDAMKYVSEPGGYFYEQGKSITDWVDQQERDNPDLLAKYEWDKNPVMSVLGGGARMIPMSLGPPLLLAGAVALLPEGAVAALGGAAVVGVGTAIAGAIPAGMSQGQQTYDKLIAAGVDDETARASSRLSGLIEWGGESVENMLGVAKWGMKSLGVGAKAAKITGKDAVEYLAKLAEPKTWGTVAGKSLADLARTMAWETGTEVGQQVGETAVENRAIVGVGGEPESLVDAAKSVVGPTIGMTLLMAPLGIHASTMDARRQATMKAAITDPRYPEQYRAAAAMAVAKELYEIDPVAADNFAINATTSITLGLPMSLTDAAVVDPAAFHDMAYTEYSRRLAQVPISTKIEAIVKAAAKESSLPETSSQNLQKPIESRVLEKTTGNAFQSPTPKTLKSEPNEPVARYQMAPLATLGQQQGAQVAIQALDEPTFEKMVRPMLATTAITFDTYRREFPDHTHVMLEKTPGQDWTLAGAGSLADLTRIPNANPKIYKPVTDFQSTDAIAHSMHPIQYHLPPAPGVRFEGTQAQALEKITGKSPNETPAVFTDAGGTYLVNPKVERHEGVAIGRVLTPGPNKTVTERLFAWDTNKWYRLPSVKDRRSNPAEIATAARTFATTHPNAVTKPGVEAKLEDERADTFLNVGKQDDNMPVGMHNPEKVMNTKVTPADQQSTPWKALTNWVRALPLFQGNKRKMSEPVTKAVLNPDSGWTPAERDRVTTIYEPFGGGGSWGLFNATTLFTNVKKIILGELSQTRLDMIAYMHGNGNQFYDDLVRSGTRDILQVVWQEPQMVSSGGGLVGRLQHIIDAKTYDKKAINDEQIKLMQIVTDLMPRNRMAIDKAIASVREQVNGLYDMAQAFIKDGGQIEYSKGDAYTRDVPPGDQVLTILDPPYVFTTGYGEQMVGVGTYQNTLDLIDKSIKAGNNVIYTDSAWWRTHNEKISKADKTKALDVLGAIQDRFDRFQSVSQRIGGHRYKVLGLQNPMRASRTAIEQKPIAEQRKVMTKEEFNAKAEEAKAELFKVLPVKVGQNVYFQKSIGGKKYKGVVKLISVRPDFSVEFTVEESAGPQRGHTRTVIPEMMSMTSGQKAGIVATKRAAEKKELSPSEKIQVQNDSAAFTELVRLTAPDYYDIHTEEESGTHAAVKDAWHSIAVEIDKADVSMQQADLDSNITKAELLPRLLAWVQANKERLPYIDTLPKPTYRQGPEIRMSIDKRQQEFNMTPPAPNIESAPTIAGAGLRTTIKSEAGEGSSSITQRIDANLQRASDMARRFNIPNVSDEEKFSVARAALVKAANKWDPMTGSDFTVYASTTIRNALSDKFNEQMNEADQTLVSFQQPLGQRAATGEAIDATLADVIPDWQTMTPEQQAAHRDVYQTVRDVVAGLRPEDKIIINAIRDDRPQVDVAKELGVNKAAISQRKTILFRKLRTALEEKGINPTMINDLFARPEAGDEIRMSKANANAEQGQGVTAAQARSRVTNWINKQINLPEITVIQSIEDAATLGLSDAAMSQLRDERPRGFYFPRGNQIIVIADGLDTPERALDVVLHEAVGHFGIEHILGANYTQAMVALSHEISDQDLQNKARDYYTSLPDQGLDNPLDSDANRAYLAAEIIAERAQTDPTLWQKFVEIVRRALLKMFPGTYVNKWIKEPTNIEALIQASRDYVRSGRGPQATTELQAMLKMSKAPVNRANPVLDPKTRDRYFRAMQTYNPAFIPCSWMVARVQPKIDKAIAKGKVKDLLYEANTKGFPQNDEGTVYAQLLLNTPEFAALFTGPQADQDMAISLTARSLEQGSAQGRALAYRRDLLQTPAERQAAILKLLSSPPEEMFKRWSTMTDAERAVATAEHRAKMKRAIKALKKMGITNISNIEAEHPGLLGDTQKFMEVINLIGEQQATWGDKIYEYWRNSILSGFQTNFVNAFSNMASATWDLLVQRPLEALVNVVVKDPNAPTFASLKAAYKMLWPHLTAANAALAKSWTTETGMFTAADITGNTAVAGTKGKIIRAPQRFLLAIDEWFKTMLTSSLAYDYATRIADRNNMTGEDRANFIEWAANDNSGNSDAYETANKEAVRLLFQEKAGPIGRSILSARNAPGLTGWVLKFIVPFITTPANLIKIGIHKSPFGIIAMGMNGITSLTDPKEARYSGPNGKAMLIRDSVEQAIAWAMTGLLYAWTAPGGDGDDDWPKITGSISGSPAEKRFQQLNIPPQSIRIGGRWYSYARIEPFATSMTLIVDALNSFRKVQGGQGLNKDDAAKILALVRDKTYLQGVGDLIRGLEDPEQWVGMAQNFGSSWTPNLLKQAIKATDPLQRDIRVRERGFAWLGQSLGVRGLQQSLPLADLQPIPKFDHWGRPISKDVGMDLIGQPLSDIAWRMLVPVRVQNVKDETNVDRMIWNWNRTHEDAQWWPGNVRPSVKIRGSEYQMTDEQFERYQATRGRVAMQMIKNINTWNFDNPTPRDMKIVEAVFNRAGERARTTIAREIITQKLRPQSL